MNILYNNQQGDISYPFISQIPFPAQCISHIKIVLKKNTLPPCVSMVSCKDKTLYILLRTLSKESSFLCRFLIKNAKYATIDNLQIFGFVRIGKFPTSDFYYKGLWPLSRDCYTYSKVLDGLQTAFVLNILLRQSLLPLWFIGDLTLRKGDTVSVVNIGRLPNKPHQDYTLSLLKLGKGIKTSVISKYVTNVNGYYTERIRFLSLDPAISIEGPVLISPGMLVLYINSKKGFPSCPAESDSTL